MKIIIILSLILIAAGCESQLNCKDLVPFEDGLYLHTVIDTGGYRNPWGGDYTYPIAEKLYREKINENAYEEKKPLYPNIIVIQDSVAKVCINYHEATMEFHLPKNN